jgi:hypothetical protein
MPFVVLALLLGAGAVMLFQAPVTRYVVTCTRAAQLSCVLERTRGRGVRRSGVGLGPEASAVVRVVPGRRGSVRILLYLQSPQRELFAAEFEGGEAGEAANAAAARLNAVLAHSAPATVRVEAAPPVLYRRLAWTGLAVMGLLTLAGYREVRRRDA